VSNDIVAIVHAKGTSDRIPSKNLRILGDKPLFCHAIDIALAASLVTLVVIDSDSEEILSIGKAHGAVPIVRPVHLADNRTTGDDLAFWQASNFPSSIVILQVIPTAPFLRPASVNRAISILLETPGLDSIVGVTEEALYKWRGGKPAYYTADGRIPNSFEMEKTVYETTGLYVNRTRFVIKERKRLNPMACKPLFLSKIEAVDINTMEDFELAEFIWKGMHC